MKITFLTLLAATTVYAGGFTSTCTNLYLISTAVGGVCKRINGSTNNSSVDANGHIGNSNGKLVRFSGGYKSSCRNCHISTGTSGKQFILSCECNSSNGWKATSIDINWFLSNQNGVLAWDK
ncbi:hypothetical protein TWF730_001756 [Orbilia blumenaviensis]|uniref:Cyanovirin-N domain-containing protein n=1 Tax=Orbilia blumenaviensis TaxID=1796055 RepID=A0AAV9UJV1_9PEZI